MMVEQDWLACTNPAAMLSHITHGQRKSLTASHRKLRLFAAAACRLVWEKFTDPTSRLAVSVAERFADGEAGNDVRCAIKRDCSLAGGWCNSLGKRILTGNATAAAEGVFLRGNEIDIDDAARVRIAQAGLLREIFGNFWQPSTFTLDRNLLTPQVLDLARAAYQIRDRYCPACGGVGEMYYQEPFTPSFRYADGPVSIASVAGTIERKTCRTCHGTKRDETGHFDPVRLAILADALEEAGCQNEDILRHLRGQEICWSCQGEDKRWEFCHTCNPGRDHWDLWSPWIKLRSPHVRGCWVTDLILGKI